MFTFASEVLTSGLLKSTVEDSKRIEQGDATDQEVARLSCDTRMSQERTTYLAPMRTEYEGMDAMTMRTEPT